MTVVDSESPRHYERFPSDIDSPRESEYRRNSDYDLEQGLGKAFNGPRVL